MVKCPHCNSKIRIRPSKIKCPKCKNNGSRVVDSRPADDGRSIRRRRECEECGYRFTTFERL